MGKKRTLHHTSREERERGEQEREGKGRCG